jgi:hypothetical protein
MSFVNNEYILTIGDKTSSLTQVMEVNAPASTGNTNNDGSDKGKIDASEIRLTAGETTQNAAVVTWAAPTDDKEVAAALRYTVYYSTEGPFQTLEDVKNGTIYGAANRVNLISDTIVGLNPDTKYYINVVVKEASGNESVYLPVEIRTKSTQAAAPPQDETTRPCIVDPSMIRLAVSEANVDSAMVIWEIATQDEVTAANLAYTVYFSKEGPFETMEDVKNGTIYGEPGRFNIGTEFIAGLDPDTTYFINVVVRDLFGGESVYLPVAFRTRAIVSVDGDDEQDMVDEIGGPDADGVGEAVGDDGVGEDGEIG